MGDPHKCDREQDLLPRGDRGERRAANAGRVERGHDRVVKREADEKEVKGDDGPPPDRVPRAGQERRVERELEDGHAPRVQRAGAEAPARRPSGLDRPPRGAAEDDGERRQGDH